MGFVAWAADKCRTEGGQQHRQVADLGQLAKVKARQRMNPRWCRELQRGLGTLALWHMATATCIIVVSVLPQAGDDGPTQNAGVVIPRHKSSCVQHSKLDIAYIGQTYRHEDSSREDIAPHGCGTAMRAEAIWRQPQRTAAAWRHCDNGGRVPS